MWTDAEAEAKLRELGYLLAPGDAGSGDARRHGESVLRGIRSWKGRDVHFEQRLVLRRTNLHSTQSWWVLAQTRLPLFGLSGQAPAAEGAEALGRWFIWGDIVAARDVLSSQPVQQCLQRFKHLDMRSDGATLRASTDPHSREFKRRQQGTLRALFEALQGKDRAAIRQLHEDIIDLLESVICSTDKSTASSESNAKQGKTAMD